MINEVESSRMSYCLADVVEMHGDAGLRGGYGLWGPAVGAMIYPDMHPTVDHFPVAPHDPLVAPGEQIVPGSMQQVPMYPDEAPVQTVPYQSGDATPPRTPPTVPGLIEQAAPINAAASANNVPYPTQPSGQQAAFAPPGYAAPRNPSVPQRIPTEAFGLPTDTMPASYNAP
ncbi:MAG: hypothetical protein R3C05_04265 [Pirellulaceae bacterium]